MAPCLLLINKLLGIWFMRWKVPSLLTEKKHSLSFLSGWAKRTSEHGICLKDIIGSICNLKAGWELLRPFWHFPKRNPWGFPACCETDSLSHNSRASQFLRAVMFLSSVTDLWVGFGEHQVSHNYQSQSFRQQLQEEKTIEFCCQIFLYGEDLALESQVIHLFIICHQSSPEKSVSCMESIAWTIDDNKLLSLNSKKII